MTTITVEEAREIAEGTAEILVNYLSGKLLLPEVRRYEKVVEDIITSSIEGWIAGKENTKE